MDTRDGTIYQTYDAAKAAGVPDEFLVTGTREALTGLRARLVFSKGSFKNVTVDQVPTVRPAVGRRRRFQASFLS